jgi:hypothetical protein
MVLALGRVMSDASLADVRAALLLDRVHVLPEAAYAHFLRVEADAVRLGYPSVC